MSHSPDNHPLHNLDTNGRGRRYVLNTHIVRPIRLDATSDDALLKAVDMLSSKTDLKDSVSTSMLCRLALRQYLYRLQQLPPDLLEREKVAVRRMSQKPGPRRRPKVLQGTA